MLDILLTIIIGCVIIIIIDIFGSTLEGLWVKQEVL